MSGAGGDNPALPTPSLDGGLLLRLLQNPSASSSHSSLPLSGAEAGAADSGRFFDPAVVTAVGPGVSLFSSPFVSPSPVMLSPLPLELQNYGQRLGSAQAAPDLLQSRDGSVGRAVASHEGIKGQSRGNGSAYANQVLDAVAGKGDAMPVLVGRGQAMSRGVDTEDQKTWSREEISRFGGIGNRLDRFLETSVLGPYQKLPDELKRPSIPNGLQIGSMRLGIMDCELQQVRQNGHVAEVHKHVVRSDWREGLDGVPLHDAGINKETVGARSFQKSHQEGEERSSVSAKGKSLTDNVACEEVRFGMLPIGTEEEVKCSVLHASTSRGKDYRSDFSRGHRVSSQRARLQRSNMPCRRDIDVLAPSFLSIFKSLIPKQVEIEKQNKLLSSLRKLINLEWPDAKLYLYGSCANSFGVSNSDIDICLHINDSEMTKVDIILKLADILQSGNFQNIQALTHARVPIVKLMDPETELSCDICINNLLAVVNTKLLKDYGKVDQRLRQLAFIVKHWAKSRRVNETYQGTLSSYAYVVMCIHILQQRRPAILPCLQRMESTFFRRVDNTDCAYFDQVERLQNYGAKNTESISKLVWAFFNYWAYHHDYTSDVISIRTGSVISKHMKDWTRRIGNDRHLICIEDPFEVSHDLGRVVDRYSIKILREEFERAANIMQFDANPTATLFEPYVPPPRPSLNSSPENAADNLES